MAQPIVIYGRRNSGNVQKVLWVCEELKIPYKQVDAGGNFSLNSKNPEYLKLNPNGLVPTIDDNGFILWESNAIVRYLARKYASANPNLFPQSNLQVTAEVDMWMDWGITLTLPMGALFRGLIRTPPEQRDPVYLKKQEEELLPLVKLLDNHLKDRDYVVGSQFTVADIPIGIAMYRYLNLQIQRPSLPNVDAWYKRLQERPGYKEHVMIVLS